MFLLGFGSIFYVSLLLINSIAILNEERFLVPLGLTASSQAAALAAANNNGYGSGFENYGGSGGTGGNTSGNDEGGIKMRLIALVAAIRTLMRIPLIPLNIIVILYELVFGSL